MTTVMIDADELRALRVLAMRALEMSESPDGGGLDAQEDGDDEAPSDEGLTPSEERPLTWQELNLVERLATARGAIVPADRLVRHIHNTRVNAVADEWVHRPTSQVTRARERCRFRFGVDCIETVWNTRVNARGRVVRDGKAGIKGYRWVGPDLAGMATEAIRELL